MADDDVKQIREYLWSKYIDFSHHGEDIDEEAALKRFEEYHRTHSIAVDGETYYLGILYFELAYTRREVDHLYLARALRILERYRDRSGESDWDAIVDRIDEARDSLAEMPDAELEKLLAQVDRDLDDRSDEAPDGSEKEPAGAKVVDGMVFVPGGSFLSGPTNQPRDVKGFWIDEYPVTNAEYQTFVTATGYRAPKFWGEDRLNDPEAPVVGVSWYDAFKFAAFAGKSLPTKDQWEKAVRGTKGNLYPWGSGLDPEHANYDQEDGTDAIVPNGRYAANVSEFGVRDAVGNVWEWTDSPDPQDSEQRVVCGGSWCDPASFVRCDQHMAAYPKDKYDNIGFRCVRVAPE